MPRLRPPTPSLIVSVAADKALADAAAALYRADLAAGVPHADAAARGRALIDDDDVRRVLVEGLDHARAIEKRQHTEQLADFAERLGVMTGQLRTAQDEITRLRRENARLKDPRREPGE